MAKPMRVTRRTVLAGLVASMAGCAGDSDTASGSSNPALGAVTPRGDLSLSSSAFDDGGTIPEQYGRDHRNVNPPLLFRAIPETAESLVLILDDPDAPGDDGIAFLHWLVWNISPSRRAVPEGWDPAAAVEGRNDFGVRDYSGPDPPVPHTYRFTLYAIETTLELPGSAGKRRVGTAMAGHVLGVTVLEADYVP